MNSLYIQCRGLQRGSLTWVVLRGLCFECSDELIQSRSFCNAIFFLPQMSRRSSSQEKTFLKKRRLPWKLYILFYEEVFTQLLAVSHQCQTSSYFSMYIGLKIPDVTRVGFKALRGTWTPHLNANKSFRLLSAVVIMWSEYIDLVNEV